MPTYTGDVNITVVDGSGGSVSVPLNSVQAVIGCAASGTVGAVVATRSLQTLQATFAEGPLMEAAGLSVQAGGTVLAIRATTATAGSIGGAGATDSVSAAASSSGLILITAGTHGLLTGSVVTISGVGGTTEANGTWVITVVSPTTFTLNGSTFTNAYTSGGTVTFTGAMQTGTGTAAIYLTGTPNDDYYPTVKVLTGGTVATTGILVSISLGPESPFGPAIALGTALTLALKDASGIDTGLTANFVTGKTLVAGDYSRSSACGPAFDLTGAGVALNALQVYLGLSGGGVGSIHMVSPRTGITGANATTLESGGTYNMDSLASTSYIFTRAITAPRDALVPTAWGGAGETEAVWMASVIADFAAVTAARVSGAAGYYNMTSAFATSFASVPIYRRSLAWAYAARQVAIQRQVHAGKVASGSLVPIVINPATDPSDGFVYHNEALNVGFDYFYPGGAGRITAARTRVGKPGYFITNPLTLAAAGSDFSLMPRALVMDTACTIAHVTLLDFVNADLQTKPNGTLQDKDADKVNTAVSTAIRAFMLSVAMISGFSVVVDQAENIQQTKTLKVTLTILGVAYPLQVAVTLGYTNALPAAP